VNDEENLIRTITQRKNNLIGHVMRGDGLMREVLARRMLERYRL